VAPHHRRSLQRYLDRLTKRLGTIRVKANCCKAAEFQARGVAHFHAVFRLDGIDPDTTDFITPPAELDVIDLADAIRYATKSTEATGHVSRRLNSDTIDLYTDQDPRLKRAPNHTERLVDACWNLGGHPDWTGLRQWAHMLGFGGHFLTKSRGYSITFRILRQRRVIWRRTVDADQAATTDGDTTLIVGTLTYAGSGWKTLGDAMLANTSAAMAREHARVAREELAELAGQDR
jgi:hypothetical protein